jgi:hypothetical protein
MARAGGSYLPEFSDRVLESAMFDLRTYLSRPLPALVAVTTDPVESWIRFWEQYIAHLEGTTPSDLYGAESNWESQLQELLGLSSLAHITTEFWALWTRVMEELKAKGVKPGPESFKGWNDGDAAFVRAIWYLVRQLQPRKVVETGVAHGVTSRFILEALEKNGIGQLWSIDRQPMEPEWKGRTGMAVDGRLLHRWSYVLGSSRRRLRGVLFELGEIDLFIHDSLHSERNVRFEMDHAWAALCPGGLMVVDDVDTNRGFHSFIQSFPDCWSIVCEAEPLRPDPRRFNEKGLFGIVRKQAVAV